MTDPYNRYNPTGRDMSFAIGIHRERCCETRLPAAAGCRLVFLHGQQTWVQYSGEAVRLCMAYTISPRKAHPSEVPCPTSVRKNNAIRNPIFFIFSLLILMAAAQLSYSTGPTTVAGSFLLVLLTPLCKLTIILSIR